MTACSASHDLERDGQAALLAVLQLAACSIAPAVSSVELLSECCLAARTLAQCLLSRAA